MKTPRTSSRYCRDARVYGHATAALHGINLPPQQGIGRSRRNDRHKGKASAKKHIEIGETVGSIYGRLGEGIGMKTYLHGPMDFAKNAVTAISCRDLNLPESTKRYTSSREKEEVDAQMCPCGKEIESRTPIRVAGECEMYKEERGVLEEMRGIDECGMEEFDTLDSSEKTIVTLEDRWWPQAAKQQGDKTSKKLLRNTGKQYNERSNV